ncbi:probable pinoresinol-lariciresinol reductase 3 isoform X2 [Arachis duranensis]|uniref:Probable pinoresinol-lariciresinol reductase 3 isoform X2 n=1 Tax=Arachis duranensis TaxID=130453 RepID=A0A9C6TBG5_ARADU|nr:probable pinoresinol-lariciresinol reductase 3 isoform X2 [Arachis duranensis]
MVEAEHIPYTCICYNFFMKILLPSLVQPGLNALPSDKVTIFGDGNKKGVFVKENDVAAFTISTVDKPRTLNKLLYLRPSKNICSLNELVEMWETKIGKKLEKSHISEEELIKKIEESKSESESESESESAASFAMASTSQKEIISDGKAALAEKKIPKMKHLRKIHRENKKLLLNLLFV